MLIEKWLTTFGKYLILMGRSFSRPERMRMFLKQYIKEMSQLGVDSIGIVLLISFFIGAVICIQMKLNIQSPWMPRWVSGYTTREIMLLEFSSSIMCLILAGKVGSNIASELGTMRVTQQIDALDIMGVNSACYLILPKILGLVTIHQTVSHHEPQLDEEMHCIIERSSAHPEVSLRELSIQLFKSEVSINAINRIQNCISFRGLAVMIALQICVQDFTNLGFIFLSHNPC